MHGLHVINQYMWWMSLILGQGKWASQFLKSIWNPSRQVPLYSLVQLPYLPCILSVNVLYNDRNSIDIQHMNQYAWANHVPMSWLSKMCKNWCQIMFLFIIIVVSNMMNMYELTKMNGMSVWSSNVCEECPSSLENGNEQASSLNTFEILMDSYVVYLCTVSTHTLYT